MLYDVLCHMTVQRDARNGEAIAKPDGCSRHKDMCMYAYAREGICEDEDMRMWEYGMGIGITRGAHAKGK
jgi:hypothetical protein